jgi:hypothetical protein
MIKVNELHVQVYHGCQKFNQPMKGVHQDGVHKDMPPSIITMDTMNIWHLGLQLVVTIPHKKIHLERDFRSRSVKRKSSNLWFFKHQWGFHLAS